MDKRRLVKWFACASLAAVLLCALMIFGFSAQNAEKSSDTSAGVVRMILQLTDPSFRSLDEDARAARIAAWQRPIRKAAHFTEYAMLGFLLIVCQRLMLKAYGKRRFGILPGSALALAGGVLYAFTDEWHQSFSLGRGAAFSDVLLDSAGALTGVLLFILLRLVVLKRRRNHSKQKTETV